ncbi:hypothetical protein L1049_022168 [Liquidambar formosana]|uniref:RNase H type-1 domain-containing protein n=1 Tax=Liquidambar formosana TaxID=63359 RepID=A0AAP0WQN9_LIQFO
MSDSVSDLITLKSLGIVGIPRKAPSIIPICWYPPSPSWIKLNTDGLAKGSLGLAAAGGVFRNCRGFVKGWFYVNIGIEYDFYAELLAAINVADRCANFGLQHMGFNWWSAAPTELNVNLCQDMYSLPSYWFKL